jgi:hypothetical protein
MCLNWSIFKSCGMDGNSICGFWGFTKTWLNTVYFPLLKMCLNYFHFTEVWFTVNVVTFCARKEKISPSLDACKCMEPWCAFFFSELLQVDTALSELDWGQGYHWEQEVRQDRTPEGLDLWSPEIPLAWTLSSPKGNHKDVLIVKNRAHWVL